MLLLEGSGLLSLAQRYLRREYIDPGVIWRSSCGELDTAVDMAATQRLGRKREKDIHEIKIDKFLLVKVGSGNVLQDVREQGRDILPQGHGHDGLLDRLLALIGILGNQTSPQLKGLALPGDGECAANAIYRHG